jgi:ABC-2 type transport system permease protein
MYGVVIRRELTEGWREGRIPALALLLVLLALAAALGGWQQVDRLQADREAARMLDRDSWESQGVRNPHSAAHFGQYAFRTQPLLALVDPGIGEYTGTAIWLEAHVQNAGAHRPVEDATEISRFGTLSVAWVLQVVLPLVLLVMTAAMVCAERERGTLRQVLAAGQSPGRLLFAKLLACGVVMAAIGVPLLALLWLGARTLAEADPLPDTLLRAAAMTGAYALYGLVFMAAGLAVSALAKSTRAALALALAAWIVMVVIVPRVATDLGERLHPVPQANAFWEAIRADTAAGPDGQTPQAVRRTQLLQTLLDTHGVASEDALPVGFAGMFFLAEEEWGNQVFDLHFGELWARYFASERVRQRFALLSPTLAISRVSMGMAGTDLAHHRHFVIAAEAHRRDIVEQLNMHMALHGAGVGFAHMGDESLWREVPDFSYRAPTIAGLGAGYRFDVLILFVWLLLGGGLLVYANRRLGRLG